MKHATMKSVCRVKLKSYIFSTEDDHKWNIAKDINKKVVDDDLEYKNYKIFCFIDHI